VVQARALAPGGAADERDPVVIGVAPEEHHAAGDHAVRIAIADRETEQLRVEAERRLQVRHVEDDVADLAQVKGKRHVRHGGLLTKTLAAAIS
jgi:hypothetical protein